MRPREHVIYGTIASAALYPFIGAGAAFFWAASFAIDVDHYLDYVYHNGFRDFSVKRMFGYHNILMRSWGLPEFISIEVFHTLEFIAPLYIVSVWSGSAVLRATTWGFIFHIMLDVVFLARHGIFFKRANSFAEYFIRKRMMENSGLLPEEVYNTALRELRSAASQARPSSRFCH